ncbi:MAG: hypothetical protein K2F78_00330, partial [Muribaculaceae bacterium]|nr:hypothetical protein [Muribaculaceae bacterium]
MRLPREEARREENIKGVYSRFILAGLKSPNFISSQEYSKVDAHGYVFTYPGSFYALTGME